MAANSTAQHTEVGFVVSAKRYLLALEGLPSARVDDLLVDEEGNRALVTSLERDHVEALALDPVLVKPGVRYSLLGSQQIFSCGEHLFGRIINALGEPVDEAGGFPPNNTPLLLDVDAASIDARELVENQFHTGVTLVDTLLPIAKGQRQLMFGPMRSGKTTFLKDVVVNQRTQNTICIYAAIGKPIDGIRNIASEVLGEGGGERTIILSALSDDPSPLIAIAPSVAFLLAEHFQKQGEDVLVILDDLDTHAKYLREIALLQGRLPGRESYPGDIFYQHAHLMERSGHFNKEVGGGSITTFPVIETDIKNYSDLIPTNLMACTDGHFSFSAELRAQGVYPSISEEQSVTRVGRNAQTLAQKQLATRVLSLLAEYRRQVEYTQFGAQVSEETKKTLHQGELLTKLLEQEPYDSIPADIQVPLLSLALTPFLLEREVAFLEDNKQAIISALREEAELQELRELVKQDTPLEQFLKALSQHLGVFERVCQQ